MVCHRHSPPSLLALQTHAAFNINHDKKFGWVIVLCTNVYKLVSRQGRRLGFVAEYHLCGLLTSCSLAPAKNRNSRPVFDFHRQSPTD